jgi:tetratricopeptide (TPR) repeat protein
MHAAFFLRQKAYFDVLHNGVDAIKLLKNAKEIDSTNADADFFLGLYDYGKSELKKKLWMVLFWYPGSKKEGIEKLKQCSENAILTRIAAKLCLSDIYVQEKKPELSKSIITQLENQYQNSRFVLWAKVKYLESVKNYDSAAAVYEKLSTYYALIPEGKQNFFVTRNRMAHMLKLSGKEQNAAEICRSLLKDQQFDQYRDIQKDTRKLLENLNNGKS